MLTQAHYIGVYYTYGLLHCVHYNEDFVIVSLAGLKSIVGYTEDFVILRFVESKFHCNCDQL